MIQAAERPLAGVARVVDDATAEHADLNLGIEQDEVDRGLGLGQRVSVLGVQVARVAQLEYAGPALSGDACVAEVNASVGAKLIQVLERERRWMQASTRPDGSPVRGT